MKMPLIEAALPVAAHGFAMVVSMSKLALTAASDRSNDPTHVAAGFFIRPLPSAISGDRFCDPVALAV
jgi:hypothetical protein